MKIDSRLSYNNVSHTHVLIGFLGGVGEGVLACSYFLKFIYYYLLFFLSVIGIFDP